MLTQEEARQLVLDDLYPKLRTERERLDRIDRWWRWEHDDPHRPKQATKEYEELVQRAQTPWLGLVVSVVAQSLYVEGYRHADAEEEARPWDEAWQPNGMDRRQIAIHRAALAYGLSYVSVLPGKDPLTGDLLPTVRGVSPRRMMAYYVQPEYDDWPRYVLQADPQLIPGRKEMGEKLRLFDDQQIYEMWIDGSLKPLNDDATAFATKEHGVGVPPVVRFMNDADLEGRTPGEVEPYIATAARVDQTTFDRLVIQRFASWVVRTIAGMAKPGSEDAAAAKKLQLMVDDILVAEDPDTKFGSLPASDVTGLIKAHDADMRDLGAITQTPPTDLLGQLVNVGAEALAAADAGRKRKGIEREHSFGESHEQWLRLSAHVVGDEEGARDMAAQVRWADTESRSLAQAADAMAKLEGVAPPDMLVEKIMGWTQQDVERVKAFIDQKGGMDALLSELAAGQNPALQANSPEPALATSPNGA